MDDITNQGENPYKSPVADVESVELIASDVEVLHRWNEGLTIDFEVAVDDLVACGVYHNLHSSSSRRRYLLSWFLLPTMLIMLGLFLALLLDTSSSMVVLAVPFWVSAVVIFLALPMAVSSRC